MKKLLSLLITSLLVAGLLAGCGSKTVEDDTEETTGNPDAIEAIAEAEAERQEQLRSLRKVDVLEGCEFTTVKSYLLTFPDMSTEDMDDIMVLYDAGTESRSPSYLVIAKVTNADDSADIQNGLVQGALAQEMGENTEITTAIAGGYVVMSAADNAYEVADKFTLVMEECKITSSAEVLAALSESL
jgi:hypothetical protein